MMYRQVLTAAATAALALAVQAADYTEYAHQQLTVGDDRGRKINEDMRQHFHSAGRHCSTFSSTHATENERSGGLTFFGRLTD